MEEEIINALTNAGGHLTRNLLWAALPNFQTRTWDEYYSAEQTLVDARQIERRRGRNGGIYLVPPASPGAEAQSQPDGSAPSTGERTLESSYYQPVHRSIIEHWTEQPGFTHVFAAVTAGQGSRQTGGRWSRPDLVVCTVSDWLFSSRPEGEIRTIEVKRFEALDILGVYEAVSHRSRAHYSYILIVNFPNELDDDQKTDFDNVLSVAGRHGVGVITAGDATDWNTWIFELDARRSDSDSQAIHQFLLDQVPPEVRDAFRKALRRVTVEVSI